MSGDLHGRYAQVLDAVREAARPGEISAGWLAAERSDFVRFNHGRVRQCGSVERATLELRLITGACQARRTLTLSGDPALDLDRVGNGVRWLREALARSHPDPWLSFSTRPSRSRQLAGTRLPLPDEAVEAVCTAADSSDLAGLHAAGPLARGFASSLGHEHWHETDSWFFDHSLQVDAGRAAKARLAGGAWSAGRVRASIDSVRSQARVLCRAPKPLDPGRYRSYLSPPAVADLLGLLAWDGFSVRAHRSGQACLAALRNGEHRLDARVHIAEDLAAAQVPMFQAEGFARPPRLDLVREGRFADWLASPRSAREFAVQDNGAADAETPEALAMQGGDLDEHEAFARLGTGVAIGNLWYLNFSDRQACRVTGMTRFATFWVHEGQPVAPVAPMRVDDSVYRMLGGALEALTRDPVQIPDTDSYEGRRFGSITAPGALLEGLDFTL